ncbi:MAG: hypothetical protein ACLSG5_17465, partial [Oscillospiraceae bacterium]
VQKKGRIQMNLADIGNLLGFPTEYLSFSFFIGKIINWGVGTLFLIWGINLLMSMIRKVVLIAAGVKGE